MQARYCLNLHEKYAPNWGVWEVVRELYANAKDAAPDTMAINATQPDILTIDTPTVPDIAEMLIIGHGSKTSGDASIGQFGEGFKLAALAATRSGGRIIARIPGKRIGFAIDDHLGENVLFAVVTEIADDEFEGFRVQLEMVGADKALNGKVIAGTESSILSKQDEMGPTKIFCKGIWISDLDEKDTLFHYNLNDLTLNRDRSHADPFSIRHAIGCLLSQKMTPELATKLITYPTSWESQRCLDAAEYSFSEASRGMLGEAFRSMHGTDAVLATDVRASLSARELGHQVITVGDGLRNLLAVEVITDVRVVAGRFEFDELENRDEWVGPISELRTLSNLVGIRDFAIKVFADTAGDVMGKAVHAGKVMWLNERLMSPDSRLELIRTFLHELAHLQSGAADATRSFEAGMDLLLGKLALIILNQFDLGVLDSEVIS